MNARLMSMLDSQMTVESLKEMASQKVRIDDYGDDPFHYPLEKLIQFFEERYSGDGDKKFSFAFSIIDTLTKRLFIQENFKEKPEALEIPITRPLFITGLPRTGTTLLHNLVSNDPTWRVLLYWELMYPFTRSDMGPNFEKFAINLSEQALKAFYARHPEFIKRHETKATGPEECFNLIRHSFYSIAWANEWYLPGYLRWFIEQDTTDSYRYYKKLLKLLLFRKPGEQLLLKCPSHLLHVGPILDVFTDANIVWLHRNPLESVASGLSLLSLFHDTSNWPDEFIELYLVYFKKSLQNARDIEKTGTKQLKSVSYRSLVQDPVNTVREIYQQFDYPWNEQVQQGIQKWLDENPQHKHGKHKYNLEKFGLSEEDITNRLAGYYDEYGHYFET